MSEQTQLNAVSVGTWPLAPGTYDPALDGADIPGGAAVFGLFDENYEKYDAPENIPGLTKVASVGELSKDTYFVLTASSGFHYVVVMSDDAGLTVKMSEIPKPAIITYIMQHDEFLFLGKEYSKKDADYGAIWGDFCNGGYEIIAKYRKNSYNCMVINHNNNLEYDVYSPGTIVEEGIDEIPEGFTLTKFPAREYLVVTHEWVPTSEEATGENGLGQIDRHQKIVQIPDGYVRYDGPGSQIQLIEIENMDTPDGSRWENWVPIKKLID